MTTSREFNEWQQYFKQELEIPTRQEWYLAQVAAECRRFVSKRPGSITIKQFILNLAPKGKRPPAVEAEVQERTTKSKAFWFGLLAAGTKQKKGK